MVTLDEEEPMITADLAQPDEVAFGYGEEVGEDELEEHSGRMSRGDVIAALQDPLKGGLREGIAADVGEVDDDDGGKICFFSASRHVKVLCLRCSIQQETPYSSTKTSFCQS